MSGIWKEKPDKIPPPNPIDPCLLQRAKPEAECRHYVSGRCYSPFADSQACRCRGARNCENFEWRWG